MASDASKSKARFPARFRGLVNDVKGKFSRDIYHHRRGAKSEQVLPNQSWAPESPNSSSLPESPKTTEVAELCDEKVQFRDVPRNTSLTVQVTLNFDEPLNYSYSRNYEGSPSLQPTDELCEGLLRRIDHCSQELITRKDSTALERTSTDGSAKPLRFEIHVQIVRARSEIWTSRTFKSYQRLPLGAEAAKEVILSAHYMIGLFLRHHDEGFVWKDGPVHDELSQEHETFSYRPGRVQPMTCVPRAYFLEKSQDFESIPGYTIKLSLTGRNHRRKPVEWNEAVEVNSSQATPLGLTSAENLFFDASFAIEGVFRLERKVFEDRHRSCAASDGCKLCRPHDGDGLELKLTVVNNLGPRFDHLERTIRAETNFFSHPKAEDCMSFLMSLKTACAEVRDAADSAISRVNDLEFKIIELRSRGWALDEPLLFKLDPSNCYSRRNIEAILDRVQTGVADMLRGNAIAVRMTAYKKGHFILDKTLVARDPLDQPENKKAKPMRKSKDYVLERLRQRIERDIQMVCKDTCSISDLCDKEPVQETTTAPLLQDKPGSNGSLSQKPAVHSQVPAASVPQSLPTITLSAPDPQAKIDSSIKSENDSSNSKHGASSSVITAQTEDKYLPSPPSSPSSQHQHIVITDPSTGARQFPLIPSYDEGIELENRGSETGSDNAHARRRLFAKCEDQGTVSLPQTASSLGPSIEGKRTQGEDQVSTTDNVDELSDRAYESSIAPETPSLVGGGGSPRSSLLVTPSKVHEPISSTKLDSDGDDGKVFESSSDDTPRNLFNGFPIVSSTSKLSSQKLTSSPPHQDKAVRENSSLGITANDIPEMSDLTNGTKHNGEKINEPTFVEGEHSSASAPGNLFIDTKPSAQALPLDSETDAAKLHDRDSQQLPIREPLPSSKTKSELLTTGVPEFELPEAEGMGFSQSKLDFEFSSPGAITPPAETDDSDLSDDDNDDDEQPSTATDKKIADTTSPESPDPSEDVDSPPSPSRSSSQPQLAHRYSFGGSAGHIGFHEHQFGSMDLRKALMRSPHRPASRSSSSNYDNDHDEARSATPPTPLLRSITPEVPEEL
ncbi:hypothetical protein F5X96DRAFT_671958 [Biscogniauxia mediterranea]|nr:hypothetical protein F5X96DRAFT_671958 [Biscogniauxia mediterranea]